MKLSERVHRKVDGFSKEVCDYLLQEISEIHEARWFHRDKINSIPTAGTVDSNYDFLGDRQQPKEFNTYLRSLAPKLEGFTLAEACVNRYLPGGGMPEHIDQARYFFNVVIPLCDNGDGIIIEGTFYPDIPGQGVIFPARSAPHSVPAVKHLRYVVIFLYE